MLSNAESSTRARDPVGSHLVRPHRPEDRWRQLREVRDPQSHRAPAGFLQLVLQTEGLRELLDEISPISDFTGTRMELRFVRLLLRRVEVQRA